MPEPPTVAHFVRAFLPPTETFVGNQIATLQRYHPVVFCHHRKPNLSHSFTAVYDLQDMLTAGSGSVDRINYELARRLPDESARLLAEAALSRAARLLHFHFLVDARFFLAIKRRTRLPAVVSAYGYDVSSFPHVLGGYGLRYLKPIFREMDCFLAMSQDMKQDLSRLGCPPEKIVVHYYGTDTDRFAYAERGYQEKDTLNILICGSLQRKKAQDRVLQALRQWEQRRGTTRRFRLTLMGEGPLRPKLESMVQEYGWQDRVCLLGHVPYGDARLIEEYRRADIFTLPSITFDGEKEGIPGTLVEAMACGLPVVSTYHAGIPEVVTNEQNGLLVAEQDLGGLSAALGRLMEDCSLRERLGRAAARTAATRCRLLARTPELEKIYDRLIGCVC